MVKGISRRVIVVRTPDPRFFEQAIFFLREDVFHREGVTDEQVLSEARQVAAGYIRRSRAEAAVPRKRLVPPRRPLVRPGRGGGQPPLGVAFAAVKLLMPKAERDWLHLQAARSAKNASRRRGFCAQVGKRFLF